MDNATRRKLLERHKLSGFPGSIIDVFNAYDQGVDLVGQYMQQQQQMQVANTPQEQQQGLRPAHQTGNTNASMAFPNTPPNASFNTVGMKAPIDIKQFDETGNLVKSYDAVPPGVKDLKMSSQGGTVIETPTQMQSGGMRKYQYAGAVNLPEAEVVGYSNVNTANPNYFNQGAISEYRPGRLQGFQDAVREHNMKEDSTFENAVEAFDPTGVSSWDDAYRAYNSMKDRGASTPNADELLDMFGAVPLFGKFRTSINLGKQGAKHIKDITNGVKKGYNFLSRSGNTINRLDAIEDETGFLDSKKTGGVRKAQNGGIRKYQSGDFWTPVGMSNYIGEIKGGEPERFYNFADSVAYHESWHTMNPNMLQQPKKRVTVEDMERIGGKGAYQIESRSLPAYWQRMKNLSTRTGTPLPSWYNENETDARNLTYDQQKTLFLINMLEHEATDMESYGKGTVTSADQWARGWKGSYDNDDIQAFETSMEKAREEGIDLPKGAQEWPSSWWEDFKDFFGFKNGGVRKFQGGSTPGKLIMDESGNIISVDLNAPTSQPVQSAPKPAAPPKPAPAPKPKPRPAPKKPVVEEPDVIPATPAAPPTPPIETPIVTPPGTIAPERRNRVNYDTPDISRAIRRNVDIYTGAAAEEGWYDAEALSARNREWSQLPYEQMIAASRAAYRPEDYYLISDNEKGTYGVYQGGRLVTEYEGLSGRNAGDAITAVPHPNGRPDYSAGNLTSGAGEFFLSNQYATSDAKYNYAPSFNFSLPNGNEQAMAIHGTPEGRLRYFENDNTDDNRQSYGCINGLCGDLKELFEMNLPKGTSWYSLPEEDRNRFEIIDGIPYLRAGEGAMEEAQTYTDAYGREQRGQGMNTINRTKPGYREIRANIDMDAFRRDIFDETGEGIAGWFENTFTTDTTDEEEFAQTTQPFVDSLVDNKQAIMQATGVSNDQYNLVAKLAFGILGNESTFGNTNSDTNNALRFASKSLKEGVKSLSNGKVVLPLPDTNMDAGAEYDLFTGLLPKINEAAEAHPEAPFSFAVADATDKDPANYSLGPTQLRWNTLIVRNKKGEIIDTSELDLVRSLGVNGPEDLNDPQKAAIATAAILAHRINNRRATLDAKTDEELIRALAGSWNNGEGYADRAIKNSQYLTLQQKDRMKLGGKKRSKYFSVRNRKPRK